MKTFNANQLAATLARCRLATVSATLITSSLLGCATPSAAPDRALSNVREEIYVLRSVREERTPSPGWCSQDRAGFAPYASNVDRFSLWSVQVRSSEGRIVNTKSDKAAEVRACFGPTADRAAINFYAEGQIAALSFIANGDCRVVRRDFPEKGIVIQRCALNLRGLPSPYVGGLLTSNTIGSKALLGGDTDPPGYLQSSIATIRLWRAQ